MVPDETSGGPRRQTAVLWRVLVLSLAFTLAGTLGALAQPAAVAAHDSAIYCDRGREERQPVLLVHGFNSGPQTWKQASQNQLSRAGSSTCIDIFDYANYSTDWVTNSKIGPALATRIDTLAAASKVGGGYGKVIIVAHSMGGLATRCAASPQCNGGLNGVAARIAELISFGTPNTGSWLVGPGLHDVGRTLGSLLSSACYASFNGANDICKQVRALGTSDATRAFKPDSAQLAALPQLTPDIPVYTLAGQIEIYTSFFGLNDTDLGDGGDAIVLEDSAQAIARKVDGIGGAQTINCGKIDITDFFRSAHSCWHSTETNDLRFLEAAAHQITLVETKFNAPALTSSQVLNASIPAGSCGDGTTGWKQPVPIQLHNGTGTARFANGSFAGSSMDQAKVIGFADFDGDGHKDVVLQFTCFGSTPDRCCAGRGSRLAFIDVLAIESNSKLRLIGPVIRAGASKPGDQYGPAERAIQSASLSGTTITTLEYIIYPDQYTPAQVGGRDPNAQVPVEHRYRNGQWVTS
jgi:pimeloyl-ACP methyl ester carboxylesterase